MTELGMTVLCRLSGHYPKAKESSWSANDHLTSQNYLDDHIMTQSEPRTGDRK